MEFAKCPQCGHITAKGVFTPLMPTPATWANVVHALGREIEWYSDPSRCLYGVLPFIAEVEDFIAKSPVTFSTYGYRMLAQMRLAKLKELTA